MEHLSRRQAMQAIGIGAFALVIPGCGAAIAAGRVVIALPWANIASITSAVIDAAANMLTIVARLQDGVEKVLDATLSDDQVSKLREGGTLLVRSADGEDFNIPFTVR